MGGYVIVSEIGSQITFIRDNLPIKKSDLLLKKTNPNLLHDCDLIGKSVIGWQVCTYLGNDRYLGSQGALRRRHHVVRRDGEAPAGRALRRVSCIFWGHSQMHSFSLGQSIHMNENTSDLLVPQVLLLCIFGLSMRVSSVLVWTPGLQLWLNFHQAS